VWSAFLMKSPASEHPRRCRSATSTSHSPPALRHEYTMMHQVVHLVYHAIVKDREPPRRPCSSHNRQLTTEESAAKTTQGTRIDIGRRTRKITGRLGCRRQE
jgi:hypothetical protein